MFTKSQVFAAAALVASASSVLAVPINGGVTEIEARGYTRDALTELKRRAIIEYLQDIEARNPNGPPYGGHGGWIHPTAGKGDKGKTRQTAQVLAVDKHRQNEPHHPAVAHGNTAHVHDHFHQNGGANHATVRYQNPHGQHVTTLHIAPDGARLHGNQPGPAHHAGTHAPPNSPVAPAKATPVLKKAHTMRSIIEYLDDFEARGLGDAAPASVPHPVGGAAHSRNPGATHPTVGKHRQETLATGKHNGNHVHEYQRVPHGVHNAAHEHGGVKHATEHHRTTQGQHGVGAPHNTPGGARLGGHKGNPGPHSSALHNAQGGARLGGHKESLPTQHGGKVGLPHSAGLQTSSQHASLGNTKSGASTGSKTPTSAAVKSRELDDLAELLARDLDFYDDLD